MPVTHVESDAELRAILNNNNNTGDKLFLVDFSAKWCGPCQNIAPLFQQLSDKHGHSNFQFIHVDVDECENSSGEHRVTALPTFVFFKVHEKNTGSNELARIQGAQNAALEAKVEEYAKIFRPHFGGEGNKLGGSCSSSSAIVTSESTLSIEEIQSIAQSKLEFDDASCKIGFRFQPAVPTGVLAGFKPTLKINGSEKISKLREFVDTLLELSGTKSSGYELHNSYPPGPLQEDISVADAGVAGAVVVIKFN